MRVRWLVWSAALIVGIGVGVGIGFARQAPADTPQGIPAAQAIPNPRLDRGTTLNVVAPAFTLTDQFGKKVSLRSYRGKVVVVSFNDPVCTTICPLTTTALLEAKKKLGAAAANVELLGISANPEKTQVKWVRDYSRAHGMLHKWRFLTGSLPQLKRVWQAYGIAAAVVQGAIDHTPATFVIDPQGRERRLFLTNMSYSSVPQLADVMARGIAASLPGHPRVGNTTSLAPMKLIGPHQQIPLAGFTGAGRTTWLGPHSGAHLLLFFNTWEQEVTNLHADLEHLNGYAPRKAGADLIAIDEANVEPSMTALHDFFYPRSGPRPRLLDYAIVVDRDGRVADGYGVKDSPWLTLVSAKGKILWSYDVAEKGWPSTTWLVNHVHAALARARG
jgi:cytochrome oxidase Cu insertion factor (SCO1/SenC/PrrC family)